MLAPLKQLLKQRSAQPLSTSRRPSSLLRPAADAEEEENTRSIEGELGMYSTVYSTESVCVYILCIIGKALFICSFKENSKLRRPAPISMNAFAFCE